MSHKDHSHVGHYGRHEVSVSFPNKFQYTLLFSAFFCEMVVSAKCIRLLIIDWVTLQKMRTVYFHTVRCWTNTANLVLVFRFGLDSLPFTILLVSCIAQYCVYMPVGTNVRYV